MFITRDDGFYRCAVCKDEPLSLDSDEFPMDSRLELSISSVSKLEAYCAANIGVGAVTPWLREAKTQHLADEQRKARRKRRKR